MEYMKHYKINKIQEMVLMKIKDNEIWNTQLLDINGIIHRAKIIQS